MLDQWDLASFLNRTLVTLDQGSMTMNIEKLDPKMTAADFKQNPHRVREHREKVLEVAIGREVRAFRRQQEITVAEL